MGEEASVSQGQDVTAIFDRIAAGTYKTRDIETLQRIGVHGKRNAVMLGNHNIALHGGREIRIDNRVYYGTDADTIRDVLASLPRHDGIGVLRGFGGLVTTIGMLVALVGMGMFFYGLITFMTEGFDEVGSGFPPIMFTGFGVAACGIGLGIVGGLISAWSKPGRR